MNKTLQDTITLLEELIENDKKSIESKEALIDRARGMKYDLEFNDKLRKVYPDDFVSSLEAETEGEDVK